MSYTKLDKEIERYYKANHESFYYDATKKESKEEQENRLKEYDRVRDIIVEKWKKEKKYKELISCAHGGWFSYEEFTKPLAEFFLQEQELLYLKVLCERDIRSKINNTLNCLSEVKKECPQMPKEEILAYDLATYLKINSYHPIGQLLDWRAKSLFLLNSYTTLLQQTDEEEYLKIVEELKDKVAKLIIKKADLKHIRHQLKQN